MIYVATNTMSKRKKQILSIFTVAIIIAAIIYFRKKAINQTANNILPNDPALDTDTSLSFPMHGNWTITSPYGNRILRGATEFHNGIDIVSDDPNVYSPASGFVTSQYSNSKGGKQMLITHDNGYLTGYADIGQYLVSTGDRVERGQAVCTMGSGGNATGTHIHFTVHSIGDTSKTIDPETVLDES